LVLASLDMEHVGTGGTKRNGAGASDGWSQHGEKKLIMVRKISILCVGQNEDSDQ
jgi:hypothetical protein